MRSRSCSCSARACRAITRATASTASAPITTARIMNSELVELTGTSQSRTRSGRRAGRARDQPAASAGSRRPRGRAPLFCGVRAGLSRAPSVCGVLRRRFLEHAQHHRRRGHQPRPRGHRRDHAPERRGGRERADRDVLARRRERELWDQRDADPPPRPAPERSGSRRCGTTPVAPKPAAWQQRTTCRAQGARAGEVCTHCSRASSSRRSVRLSASGCACGSARYIGSSSSATLRTLGSDVGSSNSYRSARSSSPRRRRGTTPPAGSPSVSVSSTSGLRRAEGGDRVRQQRVAPAVGNEARRSSPPRNPAIASSAASAASRRARMPSACPTKRLPGGGQRDAARMALEQRDPGFALERRDLL